MLRSLPGSHGRLPGWSPSEESQMDTITAHSAPIVTYSDDARNFLPETGCLLGDSVYPVHPSSSSGHVIVADNQVEHLRYPQDAQFELVVDVLWAAGLAAPEYRLGDITTWLLTKATVTDPMMRVYVEISCHGRRRLTEVVTSSQRTFVNMAGSSLRLPLPITATSSLASLSELQVSISAFDQRSIQSVIRGDPLIGSGYLRLREEFLIGPAQQIVQLSRDGMSGNQCGRLMLRVSIQGGEKFVDAILGTTQDRSSVDIVKSLALLMAKDQSMELLMQARPKELDIADEETLRMVLESWLMQLNLRGRETEDVAVWHLTRMMRTAKQVVFMCAATDIDLEDVDRLTSLWIRNFLYLCAESEGAPPALNEERLQYLMRAAGSVNGDGNFSSVELKDFGVMLPPGTSGKIEAAVVQALIEAAANEFDEVFTQERVVVDGRAAQGLAVVVRPGRSPDSLHVFLYNEELLLRWQAEHGNDPSTRSALGAPDILPLLPFHEIKPSPSCLQSVSFGQIPVVDVDAYDSPFRTQRSLASSCAILDAACESPIKSSPTTSKFEPHVPAMDTWPPVHQGTHSGNCQPDLFDAGMQLASGGSHPHEVATHRASSQGAAREASPQWYSPRSSHEPSSPRYSAIQSVVPRDHLSNPLLSAPCRSGETVTSHAESQSAEFQKVAGGDHQFSQLPSSRRRSNEAPTQTFQRQSSAASGLTTSELPQTDSSAKTRIRLQSFQTVVPKPALIQETAGHSMPYPVAPYSSATDRRPSIPALSARTRSPVERPRSPCQPAFGRNYTPIRGMRSETPVQGMGSDIPNQGTPIQGLRSETPILGMCNDITIQGQRSETPIQRIRSRAMSPGTGIAPSYPSLPIFATPVAGPRPQTLVAASDGCQQTPKLPTRPLREQAVPLRPMQMPQAPCSGASAVPLQYVRSPRQMQPSKQRSGDERESTYLQMQHPVRRSIEKGTLPGTALVGETGVLTRTTAHEKLVELRRRVGQQQRENCI